jgi:hypothetical protein
MCFDQVEFLTGFTFCTKVSYFPINSTNNAMWPLNGNDQATIKLEMVDAITFKAELDSSGIKIRVDIVLHCFKY